MIPLWPYYCYNNLLLLLLLVLLSPPLKLMCIICTIFTIASNKKKFWFEQNSISLPNMDKHSMLKHELN
jgi:hypothetical protein